MQSREEPGDKSGFVSWKWIGLLTHTCELLCSSSLQGRANKSRGKVPVTSFLQPGRGLHRGRERFPGKHREGLEKQLHATRRDGARCVGLAPVSGLGRPLPGIAALRDHSRRGLGCSHAGLRPRQSSHLSATPVEISAALPLSCTPHSRRPRARQATPNPNEFRIPPPARSSTSAPPRRKEYSVPATHLHAGSLGSSEGARDAGERDPQTQTLLLSGRRSRHFLAEQAARPGL